MITYTTISTDEDNYKLSALMTDNGYEMPSLEILIDGEEIAFWDNDNFLYKNLYPQLMGECDDKNAKEYINQNIPEDDYNDLLELFNKGIEMGFFENTKISNSYYDENAGEDIPYNS